MDNDLLRQRRNLILVSSGLLLFDFAKVTVLKVSILGTELLIGDANVLAIFAWVLWGYFLLRYYQYLRIETTLGIIKDFESLFQGRGRAYVFKKINRDSLTGSIDFTREGLRWHYTVNDYNPGVGTYQVIDRGLLPRAKATWWLVKSFLYVAFNTPKVTDHILPFLLAIAALLVGLTRIG